MVCVPVLYFLIWNPCTTMDDRLFNVFIEGSKHFFPLSLFVLIKKLLNKQLQRDKVKVCWLLSSLIIVCLLYLFLKSHSEVKCGLNLGSDKWENAQLILILFLFSKEHGGLCRDVWRRLHRGRMFSSIPWWYHTQRTQHGEEHHVHQYPVNSKNKNIGLQTHKHLLFSINSSYMQVITMQQKLSSVWLRSLFRSSLRNAGRRMMWWDGFSRFYLALTLLDMFKKKSVIGSLFTMQ